MQALEKQGKLVEMRDSGTSLLRDLLTSRSNAASLTKRFPAILTPPPPARSTQAAATASASNGGASGSWDSNGAQESSSRAAEGQPKIGPNAPPSASFTEEEFPSNVAVALLERERLLTQAKLHILRHNYEVTTQEVCPLTCAVRSKGWASQVRGCFLAGLGWAVRGGASSGLA